MKLVSKILLLFTISIIISLLIPSVLAAESKIILDKDFTRETTQSIEGITITLDWGSDTKAKIEINDETTIFDIDECRVIGDYTICLAAIKKEDPEDITDNKYNIKIKRPTTSLKITRTIDKTVLKIREKAEIITVITNDGGKLAKDIYFEDNLEGLKIPTYQCDIEGNKIVWKGSLNPGQSKTCVYTIEPIHAIKFENKASIIYNDLDEEKKVYSEKLKIEVDGIDIDNKIIAPTEMELGKKQIVQFSLRNPEKKEIKVYTTIKSDIELLNDHESRKEIRWDTTLAAGETQIKEFEINPIHKGDYNLNFEIKYVDSLTITKNEQATIKVNPVEIPKATTNNAIKETRIPAKRETATPKETKQTRKEEPTIEKPKVVQTSTPKSKTEEKTEIRYLNVIMGILLFSGIILVPILAKGNINIQYSKLEKPNLEISPPVTAKITGKASNELKINALKREEPSFEDIKSKIPHYIKQYEEFKKNIDN